MNAGKDYYAITELPRLTLILIQISNKNQQTIYLRPWFFADTVNVYPQAINRDCCDKNHQSGPAKHLDTQIISQPGGVKPTF
jgi:hypothetical protein